MNRIHVQVISKGIEQHGTIEEPVAEEFSIANALMHFGINKASVDWNPVIHYKTFGSNYTIHVGHIKDTDKIVTVIIED